MRLALWFAGWAIIFASLSLTPSEYLTMEHATMEHATMEDRSDKAQTNSDTIAAEMRQTLDTELAAWYPRSVDSAYGGFLSDLDYEWQVEGSQAKMVVTQARHIWAAANAARFYNTDTSLRHLAAHGVSFLRGTMWDAKWGGFYDLVTREGAPVMDDGHIIKRAYGNAFAIYGLAGYYGVSGDTVALHAAQEAFRWLEEHSHDSRHGGYFQFMEQDGSPLVEGWRGTPPKDQNSTIHLLEAFTQLHEVWPDPTVRKRLEELLHIVRDTITTSQGYMKLFFRRDWTPVSFAKADAALRDRNYELDHVSFGHDVETAYLMLEASAAMGLNDDTRTLRIAKQMVDHALRYGWDQERGGFFDGGYYHNGDDRPSIVRTTKEWWSQAEALNTLLLMADLFPEESAQYYEKFCQQWDYCKRFVIDRLHGGWYWGGIDRAPEHMRTPKASIWKCNYHTSRALINCMRRIRARGLSWEVKSFEPVNRDATPAARELLARLYSLSGRNIIAGHQNYVGRIDTYPKRIAAITGRSPQIWGCDFIHYDREGTASQVVREAAKKFKEGYIITLMWHAGRPTDDPPFGWKESIQAKLTDREWSELTTPGTTLHRRWTAQVDVVAGSLKELQALGVPVLWRPYHELNGMWFWWGNRKGENGSARLYRMLYDRFVNHHKLNNLIWVWNANAPRQLVEDEAFAYEDFFPGLDCVDVLAADVYHNDYQQSHHDDLVSLGQGKLVALGEVGEVPSPATLVRQPRWVWFMIWGDFVDTHNTPEQIKALYSYPGVLTHEDFVIAK
jgi:cellobiose epimerase